MSTKPIGQAFVDDVDAIVEKYRESGITLAETIGGLEIIKLDLYNEKLEDAAEDEIL